MKTLARLLSVLMFVGLVSTGCQTFTLTEEQFEQQQRGGMADAEVGNVVGVAGSAAYLGAMIGVAAAGVK